MSLVGIGTLDLGLSNKGVSDDPCQVFSGSTQLSIQHSVIPRRHKNFPDPETKVQFQQLKCSDSLYQQIVKEKGLLDNPLIDMRFLEFSNVT